MGQINAIQPTLLYGLEGLDGVASKQEAGDFEGFFSNNGYSFKKKPDLDTQDTDQLDPSLLYLPSRGLCQGKPLQSLDDSQSPSLLEGFVFAPSTESKPVNPQGVLRARAADEPSDAKEKPMIAKGLGPLKKQHPSLEYQEPTVCTFQNTQGAIPVLHQEKPKAVDPSCLQNDLDAGSCKQAEPPPRAEYILHPKSDAVGLNNPYLKDTDASTLSSLMAEKRAALSFFSQPERAYLGFNAPPPQTAQYTDALQEESVGFQASPEPMGTDQAVSDRVKAQSNTSIGLDISLYSRSIYKDKESIYRAYKGPPVKALSVNARHHPSQNLGEEGSLRYHPSPKVSSALNSQGMHQEAMQEKQEEDQARSIVNAFQKGLEGPLALSSPGYPLDLQDAQAASTDQKIQTDLLGLIADYFDKMKSEGRSWTRLSLPLGPGQDQKMQLLLRLRGDSIGIRLQDAPPGIEQVLVKEWAHLSKMASSKGLRLEPPSFQQGKPHLLAPKPSIL